MLALLCLRGNDGVRMSELVDLLWPGTAPTSAPSVVQGHISQLRQLVTNREEPLTSEGPIVWTGVCYRLRGGPRLRLDADEFTGLARSGDEAAAGGELERACELYERALEVWRGAAVADLDCLQEHPLVVALNRMRSELAMRYVDAAAAAGDHARAMPRLRDACQSEPLSEVLHARLIAVLSSAGRRSEAVSVFEQLRHRLEQDLGISPSDLVWQAYRLAVPA